MVIRSFFLLTLLCLLPFCPCQAQYRGFTGTVHQAGAVAAMNITSVPNTEGQQTFRDLGVGAVYDLHYYATKQIALEAITSFMYTPARYLRTAVPQGNKANPWKTILPIDGRVYLGPSEDFQMYIGAGLQWNMLVMPNDSQPSTRRTTHQLSGNSVVGLTFLGPQRYMVHFTLGAKFHFPIINNSAFKANDSQLSDLTTTDLSRDRDCVTIGGGITFDLDRHKRMAAMINYEYPLGTLPPLNDDGSHDHRLAHQTQTISLGIVYHIGGTR